MRYSAPYGTPEPPIGTYPRYVNGNPVTGTEGSIPPNTAIDEAQIEIVTVLMNTIAQINDPAVTAALTPSHTDLTQLWKALQALFAARFITTPITKTVHGSGADFVDLNAALNWVAGYTITPTGSVTFSLAAGIWAYTQTVEVNHPNANRITIQADHMNSAPPGFNDSRFRPVLLHDSTDGGRQYTNLKSIYATELTFTTGISGFRIIKGGVTLRNFLITGNPSLGGPPVGIDPGGAGIAMFDSVIIDAMAIWGFGRFGVYLVNASLISYSAGTLSIMYCGFAAIWSYSGLIQFPDNMFTVLYSNASSAWVCFGTEVYAGRTDCQGNAASETVAGGGASNVGAICVEQGTQFMAAAGSYVWNNRNIGITIADSSTCQFSGSTVGRNTKFQVWMNNGIFWCEGGSAQVDIYTGAWCFYGANGAAASFVGGAIGGNCSPAPDVYNTAANSFVRYHT